MNRFDYDRRVHRAMSYETAISAAADVANRAMRAAGRTKWNVDDWNLMCAEFERLSPSLETGGAL